MIQQIRDKTLEKVKESIKNGVGGPFGAAIFNETQIVCVCTNSVLDNLDPTAHAEINAIQQACKKLKTIDLSSYSLYATGFPCPMCMSAILWAGIETVYFSQTVKEATELGFKDEGMYKDIGDITEFLKLDVSCIGFEGINSQDRLFIHSVKDSRLNEIYDVYKKEGEVY